MVQQTFKQNAERAVCLSSLYVVCAIHQVGLLMLWSPHRILHSTALYLASMHALRDIRSLCVRDVQIESQRRWMFAKWRLVSHGVWHLGMFVFVLTSSSFQTSPARLPSPSSGCVCLILNTQVRISREIVSIRIYMFVCVLCVWCIVHAFIP